MERGDKRMNGVMEKVKQLCVWGTTMKYVTLSNICRNLAYEKLPALSLVISLTAALTLVIFRCARYPLHFRCTEPPHLAAKTDPTQLLLSSFTSLNYLGILFYWNTGQDGPKRPSNR